MHAAPSSRPRRAIEGDTQWPFLATAAVLTTFDAGALRPLDGGEADLARVGEMLAQYGEPVTVGPARGRWRLSDGIRREVLAALSEHGALKDALDRNVEGRSDDATQRALAELVNPRTGIVDLSGRSLDELLGMERAVDWLRSAKLRGLPERRFVLSQIERLTLVEPLRRLIAGGFEGREAELAELRAYVDSLPPASIGERLLRVGAQLRDVFVGRPLRVIYGPGGAGKSTVVAKFVTDHAGPGKTSPMPFVYLDFERVALFPPEPDTMLGEAIRQLRIEFPDIANQVKTTAPNMRQQAVHEDVLESVKSSDYERSDVLHDEAAALLNAIAGTFSQNVLFVIDTFEVVQRRGATAVFTVLRTAADLLVDCPRVRIVVIGRSDLRREDFPFTDDIPAWDSRPLKGFDGPSGRAYLAKRLTTMKKPVPGAATLDRVVTLVRGNALGLRLAATVLAREGLSGVEDAVGQQRLDEKIAQEQILGMLHTRIIGQLQNQDLKRLADPGLVVRRITAPVIEQVLAKACGLTFGPGQTAAFLLDELRNEVALVEPAEDGTLKHRSDVRLLMLPLLRRKLGDTAARLDDEAVKYWSGEPGPAARAEEIYHRLWRGEYDGEIDKRWLPAAAQFLEDALDEFAVSAPSPMARIWLTRQMDRELPEDLRKTADQVVWEWDTQRKARTLLAAGRFDEVISVVGERPRARTTPGSALWLIEIEALMLRGRLGPAVKVADEALHRMQGVDDPRHMHALLSLKAQIAERDRKWEPAIALARQSAALAADMHDRTLTFSSLVTLSRLLGKSKTKQGPQEREALQTRLGQLLPDAGVQEALRSRPALLREAAAEVGMAHPELLADALERVGLFSSSAIVQPLAPSLLKAFRSQKAPSLREESTDLAVSRLLRSQELDTEQIKDITDSLAEVVERLNTQSFES